MRRFRPLCISALCLSVFFTGNFVYAQAISPAQLPSSANPGKLPEPDLPRRDDLEDLKPPQKPGVVARAPDLAPELASKTFTLKAIRFEGLSAFSQEETERLYHDDIGHEVSVARLFDILTALQQMYFEAGYTLTKVSLPEQDVSAGIITFQIIEGYIAEVDVDPLLRSAPLIDDFSRRVKAMHPLNVRNLERLLLLLNDRPGLSVSSILSPLAQIDDGTTDASYPPGAVRLILKKNNDKNTPLGFLDFDNHGSNYSGPQQLTAGLMLSERLPNYSDMTGYLTQSTSPKELRQGGLECNVPMAGISGLIASFKASKTRTEPGYSLEDFSIKGDAFTYSIGFKYPLIRQRDHSLYMSTRFSYENTYTDILLEPLFRDRIRTHSWGAEYYFSDEWRGYNSLNLTVTKGLNILGAHANPTQDTSRAEGESSFLKLEFAAARLQTLSEHYSLLGSLRTQYTNTPLLASEEFGFGGSYLGRGYDTSEITGDKGFSLSFELRRSDVFGSPFLSSELYGFYDFGQVWNIDTFSSGTESAASTGIGFRGTLPSGLSVDFSVACPLTKPVETPPTYSDDNGPRALFFVRQTF